MLIPIKNEIKRDFYAEMCRVERWNVRTLRSKIDSMLYERTALSKKPEALVKAELKTLCHEDRLTPSLVFRDPYVLEFLELKDRYLEKDKGQMELYLRWLDKHERRPGEEPPMGLILCAGKRKEQIELLELGRSGIHVAEYLTELPSKEILREKLHKAIEHARIRLEAKGDLDDE